MGDLGIENPVFNPRSEESHDYQYFETDVFLDNEEDDLSDFNDDDFENFNNTRKELQDSSKWRDGPAPSDLLDNTIQRQVPIGSLSRIKNDESKELNSDSVTANKSLLKYFQDIAINKESGFDFMFVNNLLKLADVNLVDIYGQTLLHEVAREWHVDVAKFLKIQGIEIDRADKYGRTPLFVASAANHHEMVNWLIENKVNIFHKCKRGQMAIHYAAIFGSLDCMRAFINAGVHPNLPDSEQQTPLFLAAKTGNLKLCNFLLMLEVPCVSYTIYGSIPTEQAIMNCTETIAMKCLDQFVTIDKQTKDTRYHLSEFTDRRWKILSKHKNLPLERKIYPSALETIVDKNELDMIMHPISTMLISVMMQKFGKKFLYTNIAFNLLFTICWTIAVTLHRIKEKPTGNKFIFIIICGTLGTILAVFFLIKIFLEHRSITAVKNQRHLQYLANINQRRSECHPQWIQEIDVIEKEMESALMNKKTFWSDTWAVIDLFCLILTLAYTILQIFCLIFPDVQYVCEIRGYYSIFVLLLVWLRLNRCLQILESMGQFISCFSYCLIATLQFSFLYLEFFIPLFCAFWVLFGGPHKENATDSEYRFANDMLYQLYLLTIVGDYEFDKLKEIDELMAQVFVGIFLLLISCVCLNLYIALLSEAFVRVHSFATATSKINQAKALITIGYMFPKIMEDFERYLMSNCAPKICRFSNSSSEPPDQLEMLKKILNKLRKNVSDFEDTTKDADTATSSNKDLMVEFQDFESKHLGEDSEAVLDDIFSIFDDNKLKYFKVQRMAKGMMGKLQQRALIEVPFAINQIKDTLKKKIGIKKGGDEEP